MTHPTQSKHIMIVAGEASGDAHASHVVKELQYMDPELTFSGLGGPKMKAVGVELDEDLTKFAVVGFVEVLKHYGEFRRCLRLFIKKVRERKPAAIILVDYPGFNLHLAKKLRTLFFRPYQGKIIYYISPQVWAWKENRVELIKKMISRMLVLFDFEKQFYWQRGMKVDFVGHPLVDAVQVSASREDTLKSVGLADKKVTVGILPGSRQKEVATLLPIMVEAAKILYRKNPDLQFLVLKTPDLSSQIFEESLTDKALPIKILEGNYYNGINACDMCMVASGTATLETALLNKPMVVVYKTSFLTWALAKFLIKIPCIGLVNIVAERKIVPECIQFDATGSKIAEELNKIWLNPSDMHQMVNDLQKIRSALGSTGASRRAAEIIFKEVTSPI